jgi:hypothetical protein
VPAIPAAIAVARRSVPIFALRSSGEGEATTCAPPPLDWYERHLDELSIES